MTRLLFRNRKAVQVENDLLRVTVLEEGGHIAEVFDKRAGVSPLWIPHWPSIEPSAFGPAEHRTFGNGPDAKLLAGIMGHNLCLDLFGGPSEEEARAGLTVHGEASVNAYEITSTPSGLRMQVDLPLAQLVFTRTIELHGENIKIHETVDNLAALDRPLAWTQHVTLSPPFLDPSTTQFSASMARSIVTESDPGFAMNLTQGAEFRWPLAPRTDGTVRDLRRMNPTAPASAYTAHTADRAQEHAHFVAYSPHYKLAFGYIWKRADFPWLGIWEENCCRPASPWDGITITRGMEFGVSPFPESRRATIERARLLDTPNYKWLPANGHLDVEYWIVNQVTDCIPEAITWPE
jgi:hypothetical protein